MTSACLARFSARTTAKYQISYGYLGFWTRPLNPKPKRVVFRWSAPSLLCSLIASVPTRFPSEQLKLIPIQSAVTTSSLHPISQVLNVPKDKGLHYNQQCPDNIHNFHRKILPKLYLFRYEWNTIGWKKVIFLLFLQEQSTVECFDQLFHIFQWDPTMSLCKNIDAQSKKHSC